MGDTLIGWNVIPSLKIVLKKNLDLSKSIEKYLAKKVWSSSDRQDILECLSKLFIQPSATFTIAHYFCPLLLDIVSRVKLRIESTEFSSRDHKEFCVALSQCLSRPDIQRFTLDYGKGKPSFTNSIEKNEPVKKKAKRLKHAEEAMCHAAWLFVHHLREDLDTIIDMEDILPHLAHTSPDIRWFACQTVIEHQRMSSKQRETFLQKYFKDGHTELKLKHGLGHNTQEEPDNVCNLEHVKGQTTTNKMILETDLCGAVICVNGILLSRVGESEDVMCLDLLPVPSNEMNLHNLAVAVSSGDSVLLQGVVGCGKTSLVEHLARLTGRMGPPQLTKIQLGDQMDSKALLGTYRCTEVPGEFIWQPGVLTQAVTKGYWVLLEDIDYAPMEVVSVLLPLLESRTLSVPGHGDCIKAAPGFHLFATQRLVGGLSGLQKQQTGSSTLLEKLWTSILLEPMSREELAQVLCKKYPKIESVMEKLLDIYFLLSAGNHQTALDYSMETNYENVGKFLSHDGRLISTRDLMTWCGRVSADFDAKSTDAGSLVFQEAWDCFVSCLSRNAKRLPLAEAIGAKLNLTKIKVEYFCTKYKPDVHISPNKFTVGRVALQLKDKHITLKARKKNTFSYTRQSSVLLEKVAVCVRNREPVLLVGETGTGKTSSVQFLAEQLGHTLHVINMNQQSDSADLLGGFKPVDVRHIIKPFYEDFELLFCDTFSQKQNRKFLGHLQDCFGKRKWDTLFSLMEHTSKSALQKYKTERDLSSRWKAVSKRLCQLKLQVKQTQNALAFTFMEGSMVKAIRNGDWVLLDEINLAAMETLECLSGLLESTAGSVLLMERGDMEPIVRHPDFRLFACMNPATDVGKKDLSPGIRNRFTELFVDELEDPQDLKVLVHDYLEYMSLNSSHIDGIVKFYLTIRNQAVTKLTDSTGHRPHYSLRTLCRALKFVAGNPCGAVQRSVYEGFCLSFLTQLDRPSRPVVEQLVSQYCLGKGDTKSILKRGLPMPVTGKYLKFEDYWIPVGTLEPSTPSGYILTPSVRANLKDLARVVSAGQHPVLIQGETSVGKTSLIKWLAESSGNVCMRVNNHEHTDLQEYVGCYAADEAGKLVFKDGVLVEAMKKGFWIILDELNLAPTDVLEALNRLLDDNRELYIPETQETVRAHEKFMLFATQNPPGHYGGRKLLSRAFRNRFIELHYDEIPSGELQTILHERCAIPLSYAKRLVSVMLELQTRRRGSGVFAGKLGFMTLRDLFRWAERYKCPEMDGLKFYDWDKHLANQGYMLLAGRVRKPEEGTVIKEVIEKKFKCKINVNNLYTLNKDTSLTTKSTLEEVLGESAAGFPHIYWTESMRRLAVLIGQAVKYREPVLLVGDTGCGKTTICQLYAAIYKTQLHSINCHLHTESADFLGGLRPVRSHTEEGKKDKLFEWVDGPLIQAMKTGSMFLVDEISLADDSVLERLNSVLEPERTILLAEKGGGDGNLNEVEQVTALETFHIFGTMNPGGDFGKKELSPALRNRFTEIWCPPTINKQDLIDIIEHNLSPGIHLCNQEDGTSGIGKAIMKFVDWFTNNELGKRCTVSIRDILTWVRFINQCSTTLSDDDNMDTDEIVLNKLEPAVAYIHGACLVFLDGLGAGTTSQGRDAAVSEIRGTSLNFLLNQVNSLTHQTYTMGNLYLMDGTLVGKHPVTVTENGFSISPFSINKGGMNSDTPLQFALEAPGTCKNAQRVLRALQLPRPLLLEGSPGVGKTSLVAAIAKASGRQLVRINLSEQTDVTDLFGADLPVEGAEGGVFAWRDGPLLQALKEGSWVVLDELNLASQSVLEGLNACLDHRAEVYVPELDKTFQIQHEKTRLFACQNPLNQGGGRKGLPRSFLNRFTQVYVEPLSEADLMFIAGTMYPTIPTDMLQYMVKFNMQIHAETVVQCLWGQRGSPWEFNLRDLFRWCDLLLENQKLSKLNPGEYVGLIYADRMRRLEDKQHVNDLYRRVFPDTMELYMSTGQFICGTDRVQVGHSFLPISKSSTNVGGAKDLLDVTHHCLEPLESVMKCVQMNWMAILVGSQGCGKSSLVKMLSTLTGNQLNTLAMNSAMDTTELLGGFEQADINRHIEELTECVRVMVQSISKHCLLHNNAEGVSLLTQLQGLWKNFGELHRNTGENRSTVEEHTHMKEEVTSLSGIVDQCLKLRKKLALPKELRSELTKLQSALSSTHNKLLLAVPGAGGGAFEWIDSLLVKSLKHGHWLLVDNVNFCNASVLDRLNALLEPNGVLHINERGVIDGQIPTIKPHPNFRLFLVMDPKYGEISRAMRNRGVEIYVPGEDDGKSFGDFDLQLITKSLGVTSQSVFTWLRAFHASLCMEVSLGDKPTIQHLLHACRTIVSHCNLGYGLREAVWKGCYSVYVQTQRRTETKQRYQTILTEHYSQLPENISTQADQMLGLTPFKLPAISECSQDPAGAVIKRNSAVLVHILETCAVENPEVDMDTIKLKLALSQTFNNTPTLYTQQMVDWLKHYRNSSQLKHNIELIQYLLNDLESILEPSHHLMSLLPSKKVIKQLAMSESELLADMQWNQQLCDKLLMLADEQTHIQIITDSNRAHIMLKLQIELALLQMYTTKLQSALELERASGKQTFHPALSHLMALLPELSSAVTQYVPNMDVPDYNSTVKVLNGIQWLARLYELAVMSLKSEDASSKLSLFWKWFNNRTLPYCVAVDSDNKKLRAVVTVLQELLSKDDVVYKLFVKIWRGWGHSSPFMTELEGKDFVGILGLLKPMCLWRDHSELTDRGRVKLIVHRRQFILETLRFLLNNLGDEEMRDHVSKLQLELQTLLRQCGLLSMYDYEQQMEQDSEFNIQTSELESQNKQAIEPVEFVQLWPLFEYVSTLQSWTFLDKMTRDGMDKERLDLFCEFSGLNTPMDGAELMLYADLLRKGIKNGRPSVEGSILQRLRKCTTVHNTERWLEWGVDEDGSEEHGSKRLVQKSFHQARLSNVLFSLLSRADNSITLSLPCNVKLDGALDRYRAELKQLAYIVQHLWTHVSVYMNKTKDTRLIDTQSLLAALQQTLLGLTTLLNNTAVQEYTELVQQLGDRDQERSSRQRIDRIIEIVKSDLHMTDDVNEMIVACLEKCCDGVKGDMMNIGEGWISVGLLNLHLLAPKGPIDPVEKLAVKVKLMKEELLEVNTELDILSIHHKLMTGKELVDLSQTVLHPRIPYLVDRSRELTQQIEALGKQVAYRPSPSQYKQLVTDIENYIGSVASPSNIYKIVKNLQNMMKRKSKSTSALQEVELWETSQDKFIERLQGEYPLYRDLTEPFICAVHRLVHGMHVLSTAAKQKHEENALCKVIPSTLKSENLTETLENLLVTVGKFPTVCDKTPTCVSVADLLVSDTFHSLIGCVLSKYSTEDTDPTPVVSDSILTCSLFHIQNEAKMRGELTPHILETLTKLLETFVLSWKHEEEERRGKEELEASLYRFKEEVHGDERSEEEQLAADLKETFPQFQQDFQDLIVPVNFEDNNNRVPVANQSKQSSSLHISTVQMAQIHSVHTQLYTSLISTSWYQSQSCDTMKAFDWIRPVLCSYTAATTLNGCLQDILSSRVDSRLLGTHLMVAVVQRYFVLQDQCKDLPSLLPEKTGYDIYHDPNVPEVIQCLPVLENLMIRVNQLLEEWPDHPTLKQLVQIVDRIRSLPISCPVIKFLTGIELLLQKAQDWESYAAKHVSMMTQLSEISHLIIQWRKLELSCWTNLLSVELQKYQSRASKWWFHLYELLHSALQPVESGDKFDIVQVSKMIKQFMEEATLGDYDTRLNMLLSYHCQLAAMETRSEVTVLLSVSWNLYQIYSKFSPSVKAQLDLLRSPIEKELKGFVKIARWSDINYWALKEAVDKTHRILHKHIKQFQNVLRQPVQPVLADTSNRTEENKPVWTEQLQTYSLSLQTAIKTYTAPGQSTETDMLEFRFPLLCVKINKFWGQIVSGTQYIDHVTTLDQFIVELITEVHELQALDVDRNLSKEKQKSEAKHINLRKRKSLSDLYKYLAKLGLSYRKGLTMSNTKAEESIRVPPTDLTVAFKSEGHIPTVWEGCLHYYYTCVSRKAQFDNAILTPSKELGISNIERCKGFSEHMFSLLVDQYCTVSSVSEQYRKLGQLITDSERLLEEQRVIFCQNEASDWMTSCKELLIQIGEGLNQFLVLLLCCPEKETSTGHHPSPLPVSELSEIAMAKQGDELITDTVNVVKKMLEEVEVAKTSICGKDSSILLWSDVCNINTVFTRMSSSAHQPSIVHQLQAISKLFNDPAAPDHPNAFTDVLHFLSNEIRNKSESFMTWFSDLEKVEGQINSNQSLTEDFSAKIKDCVHFILISVQKLKKEHVSKATEDGNGESQSIEDEVEDIKEGLLVKHVFGKLQSDRGMLDCGHVVNEITDMLDSILNSSSLPIREEMLTLYGQFLPLLKQYRNIMQHDLISNVAAERVLGKLLSVLLNMFTDLATKGFCIPPELSDEMEGEGATEFCDIENGGLGDGEGAKNVSDQIENEDQLDDAKRPEDRKEEDKSDQPDVKSEENAIEMSEEFDGKIQDLEDADKQEDNEEEDKDEEDDVDKQMGDVEGEDEEKLDEQMWGGDEEEEENKEQKEETGPGDGKQSESELVAKDDKKEDPSGDDKETEKNDNTGDDNKEQKPNNMDEMDQEYDDEQIDPYHEKQAEDQKAPDDLDLPDDLKLDDDEGEEAGEDTPMDTEKETDAKDEDETTLPPEDSKGEEESEEAANEDKKDEEKEKDEGKEGEEKEGEEKDGEKEEGDNMETDDTERQDADGKDDPGFTPQDESAQDTEEKNDEENETEDKSEGVEHYGKTSHNADTVEQNEAAQDMAGEAAENDEQEAEGSGQASAELEEGHKGQTVSKTSTTSQGKRKQFDRQPGKSDSERSLGSDEQKYKKLKTVDTQHESKQTKEDTTNEEADEYEHIKEATDHHDAQTLDTATKDQQEEQAQIKEENEEKDENVDGTETMEDKEENDMDENAESMNPADLKKSKSHKDGKGNDDDDDDHTADDDDTKVDIAGEKVDTLTVARGFDSTIHTDLEKFHIDNFATDLDSLRAQLETELGSWNQTNLPENKESESTASELWHRYEALTSSLSQDLCEQLRLVLEPTQATKLRGDYRTGKRLNMRKVIPYIASQFRKDKIWLRRTKPSKREYQVMLAIDDSSSMVDNHSKQIAFESLALISNALSLLEAGQLSICSFGETVNVLHPFTEQFTSQSGAHLLQYLTFEQKKTKIALLLKKATSIMMEARQHQQTSLGSPETAQLLLIVSDGRGLFMEGMETVKTAVRQAREASVFIVFVIVDSPNNKDSILDIRVPVFKDAGQMPEIKSYMDSFPFPFYILLRDINSLPSVLSDSLRQWFELVSAVDR